MGIDVVIKFELKDNSSNVLDLFLPNGYEIGDMDEEGVFEVDSYDRYYGPYYERGSWPEICGALMTLHSNPNVSKVYYGGDCDEDIEECSIEKVLAISEHYMLNGNRPYFQKCDRIWGNLGKKIFNIK